MSLPQELLAEPQSLCQQFGASTLAHLEPAYAEGLLAHPRRAESTSPLCDGKNGSPTLVSSALSLYTHHCYRLSVYVRASLSSGNARLLLEFTALRAFGLSHPGFGVFRAFLQGTCPCANENPFLQTWSLCAEQVHTGGCTPHRCTTITACFLMPFVQH